MTKAVLVDYVLNNFNAVRLFLINLETFLGSIRDKTQYLLYFQAEQTFLLLGFQFCRRMSMYTNYRKVRFVKWKWRTHREDKNSRILQNKSTIMTVSNVYFRLLMVTMLTNNTNFSKYPFLEFVKSSHSGSPKSQNNESSGSVQKRWRRVI